MNDPADFSAAIEPPIPDNFPNMESFDVIRMFSYSGSTECFCGEDIDRSASNDVPVVRLACECVYHFHCLVRYIKYELGDRNKHVGKTGILCPRAKLSCQWKAQLIDVTEENDSKENAFYTLTPGDIDKIIGLQENIIIPYFTAAEGSRDELLTHQDAIKLQRWIEGGSMDENTTDTTEAALQRIPTSGASSALIEATTKPCPKHGCSNRESHFHGHDCHHGNRDFLYSCHFSYAVSHRIS